MSVDQTAFTTALLNPNTAVPKGLVDPHGRPAGKRFDVYRNNVVSSLLDAMRTAFPAIVKLVGEKFFDAMCGVYVRQYPPSSPMLMFYGAEFPGFLSEFEPVAHLPYLPDVASLELQRRKSYHAADANVLDPQVLMDIPGEDLMQMRVDFVPSLGLIDSDHPIQSIWAHNMIDSTQPVSGSRENVMVFRPEFDVDAVTLPLSVFEFIHQLTSDKTLEQAFDTAMERDAEFDLSQAIGLMLNTKIIRQIKT